MLCNTAGLVFATNHEARGVLQEYQWDAALVTQLDEVRALLRRFREENAVVGDNADAVTVDAGESSDQGRTEFGLELLVLTAIHDDLDDLVDVVRHFGIDGDDIVKIGLVASRRDGGFCVPRNFRVLGERCDDIADTTQCIGIVNRKVVGNSGGLGVQFAATEFLWCDIFTSCSLNQWWACQEDGALVFHNDCFIAHCRHVCAAGGTGSHHGGNLRNAAGREVGLVVENATEVVAIRENFILVEKHGPTGVDQVNARQVVKAGDLLCAQMLLDSQRVVRTTRDGCVISNDQAATTFDDANAGDDASSRNLAAIHFVSR